MARLHHAAITDGDVFLTIMSLFVFGFLTIAGAMFAFICFIVAALLSPVI